jgi:23S rRNA pseudouridine1911/1915/1917 synthase
MPDEVEGRVTADEAGMRFDRVVARVSGLSRSAAKALVEREEAKLDGRAATPTTRVSAGARVTVSRPDVAEELEAGGAEFLVARESKRFVVVNKPAGLVVHPGAGRPSATLVNGLVAEYPELRALGAQRNWGLVHRLDRDTSGLLVVARDAAAHEFLQDRLRAREVTRKYLALAAAREFDNTSGTIDAPMGRHPSRPMQMAVVQGGRPAITHYRRMATWPGLTLLEVTLETGRTHQIRVHFAAIGAPLVGDRVYGGRRAPMPALERVWLHAGFLSFPDPDDGREVIVEAPLPDDLTATLRELGEPDRGDVP